jgi:FkbM family methyltransferase
MFTTKNGLVVPQDDEHGVYWITYDLQYIAPMLRHVPNRRVCIQAGGNIGIWPNAWAAHFADVYTFEPNQKNFKCMARNVTAMNVHTFPCAIGDTHSFIGTSMGEAGNVGTYKVSGAGPVPVLRLDDFEWPHLDLIQLDIEGFEHAALVGGERSIKAHSPTIILELKGHGAEYGHPDEETHAMLADWGYKAVARYSFDTVFMRS